MSFRGRCGGPGWKTCPRNSQWAGRLSSLRGGWEVDAEAVMTGSEGAQGSRPLRGCLKSERGPVCVEKAGWRGATKEHTRHGSVTEEQRSQAAFSTQTRRATGLLHVAFVASTVTAHYGDVPVSPPGPRTKSLVAEPLSLLRQALTEKGPCLWWSSRAGSPLLPMAFRAFQALLRATGFHGRFAHTDHLHPCLRDLSIVLVKKRRRQ